MPELPEVTTTVDGIKKHLIGLTIEDVWTDYFSPLYKNKQHIKNKSYFSVFKKNVVGAKIIDARRRAKNILIDLDNEKTILIHMKMTGHLLYGCFIRTRNGKRKKEQEILETWIPHPNEHEKLHDPYNRFIHFVLVLSNGKHVVMSDMRKFGKVTLIDTESLDTHKDLVHLGPEPLEKAFTYTKFKNALHTKPRGKIKQVLMDQTVIAGIGNIYSDEILYEADVHPVSVVEKIPEKNLKRMFDALKKILKKGIDFGGDSTSDYRNINGERGTFHHHHKVYRETGKPCPKPRCNGSIYRIVIGGRSAHFCNTHQKLFT